MASLASTLDPKRVAIKLRIPGRRRGRAGARSHGDWRAFLARPATRIGLAISISGITILLAVFAYFYIHFQKIIDARMSGQIFSTAAQIYAAPRVLEVGDKAGVHQIALELRRAGYSEQGTEGESRLGMYRVAGRGIEIRPGLESYHSADGALVQIASGKIEHITALGAGAKELEAYELEPQLITGLFDQQNRSKRRLVSYDELPKWLVDAVVAIEDQRFFKHSGVNYYRIMAAVWTDVRHGERRQGGSTITMQIARQPGFFLTPVRTGWAGIKRKLAEMLIAVELEQRFSKKQIFELYANSVNMGQRGSFGITGFGEASRAYFNKDVKELNLPESALLAAIIQRPSYLSPFRHPERALERRNRVLDAMVDVGAVKRDEADRAKATPLKLAAPNVEATDAPYFVDLIRDLLLDRHSERELNQQQYRIYTTLDPDLQRAAAEAVEIGMKGVDEQVRKLRTRRVKSAGKTETRVVVGPQAQVALVALDPDTGAVLALVGGRNYGVSQLNHAVAKRPTGSAFKPFVYAAAVQTGIEGSQTVFTPASLVDDAPQTFSYGDQIYEPRNYKEEYHGLVTARYALALSLNNATVKLAEMVGYDKVAELARSAGISSVKATPAMALGAYEATPIEVAGAYTVFANGGTRVSPLLVRSLRDAKGDVIEDFQPTKKQVLDPRVAYVITDMMEGVLNFGTAAGVRKTFTAPAAGKTGTSHDAWFAGYSSNLLCVVWVGYDDYSDLRLSGAYTAAPIWAEFMHRAQELSQYKEMRGFAPPSGIVIETLDKATNRLATPSCPETYAAAFIAGTEPHETCDQSSGSHGLLTKLGQMLGASAPTVTVPPTTNGPLKNSPVQPVAAQTAAPQQPEKKKGFFGKILGVFKGGDKDASDKDTSHPPPTPPPAAPAPPR